jgi:hypothetical protein
MKKYLYWYIPFFVGIAIFSYQCGGNTTNSNTPTGLTQDSLNTVIPDQNDMLMLLRGKWQSETDSAYVVEFTDSTLRHFNNWQMTLETDLEVDAQCENIACQPARDSTGWCFAEKSPLDTQCNLVLKCDKNTLQYAAIGAANGLLSFKKIKQ